MPAADNDLPASEQPEFSFRLERVGVKERNLVYEEAGRKLVIYLEASGIKQFDWVGSDASFRHSISTENQDEIMTRLSSWAAQQGVRIGIGPGMDPDACWAKHERAGYSVERGADGRVTRIGPRGPNWSKESEFWLRLDGSVNQECQPIGTDPRRYLRCDGFFPHNTERDGQRDRITGTALISEDGGRTFANYDFHLWIPASKENAAPEWLRLVPDRRASGWMSIDRGRKTIDMDLGAAR